MFARSILTATVGLPVAAGLVAVPIAVGAGSAARATAVVTGTPGAISAIAVVPHSSDVWAVGSIGGSATTAKPGELHQHHGRWETVPPPNLGGRYGTLSTVAATSPRSVWLGGARQQGGGSIQAFPAIWQLKGARFVPAKLPRLYAGATSVSDISASSRNNVWAVGAISPVANTSLVMLHFNGKKWSIVAYPESNDAAARTVSTSSPTNAWASDGTNLFHWNGKVWSVDGAAPTGYSIYSLATSSSKLAYAVGGRATVTGSSSPIILRFNGRKWSKVAVPKHVHATYFTDVTMHGRAAWVLGLGSKVDPILHSTGGRWELQNVKAEGKGNEIHSIAAISNSRAIAGGQQVDSVARTGSTLVMVNHGNIWQVESSK